MIPSFKPGIMSSNRIRGSAAPPAVVLQQEVVYGTTKSSGSYPHVADSVWFASDTGYFKVTWWDGTSATFGNGSPGFVTHYMPQKSISSPYNDSSQKFVRIAPSNSSGTTSGYFKIISNNGYFTNYVDAVGATRANFFFQYGYTSSGYTYVGFPKSSEMTIISLSNSPLVTSVELPPEAASIASTVYISGNTNLTSIRMVNYGSNFREYRLQYSKQSKALDIRSNGLTAAGLNQVYTDLSSSPPTGYYFGAVRVAGNPGTSTDDPTIATNKGYVVYGS